MLPQKLAFVDIETTGARSSHDRIIEIGILRVEDNKLVDTFSTLINPQTHLPPEIINLTGIKPQDLESAPLFFEIAEKITCLLKDCYFVAHNVRFDYSFLRSEFARCGMPFSQKHFCTVRLSRILYPRTPHHNLDSIIKRFHIPCPSRHRAFDDARVLFAFYTRMQQEFPQEIIEEALKKTLRKPSLPIKLNEDDLEKLPDSAGVYLFYGSEDTPLYIGKSKNIRNRVLSHFSGDIRFPSEMKITQQIEHIETITTPGELGALFLESMLIKKKLPLYNRTLRLKKQLIALNISQNTDGYYTTTLEPIETIDLSDILPIDGSPLPKFLGFFRFRKQAKDLLFRKAKEYNLCEKLLNLEKTTTACFSYRLDECFGACVKKESPMKYNLRFLTAFLDLKVKPWPFAGPILIHEKSFDAHEYLIVDKWCYLGSIMEDGDGNKTIRRHEYTFDLDTYSILKQFLNSPKNRDTIKVLSQNEMIRLFQNPSPIPT